jgi:hypothetical protein
MEMETEIFLIFQLHRYRCLASRHDVVVCLPGFVTDATVESTWPRCLVKAQMVR